jgi:hypothetical protein
MVASGAGHAARDPANGVGAWAVPEWSEQVQLKCERGQLKRGWIAYSATTYTGVHQGATHVQAGQTIALS